MLAVSEPVPEVLPVPAFEVRPIADDAEDHPPIAPREEPIASTDVEPDTTLAEQVAALTARVEEQDVALRRVLKLLVDWAESGQAPGLAMQHDED